MENKRAGNVNPRTLNTEWCGTSSYFFTSMLRVSQIPWPTRAK